MGIQAFNPQGNNTFSFAADVAAPTPVQVIPGGLGSIQYRLHNTGTVVAYIGYGVSASAATTNATTTIDGTKPTLTMVPGSIEVFTLPAGCYFTGVATGGPATIIVTAGDGV
jgi:hypothetical protein